MTAQFVMVPVDGFNELMSRFDALEKKLDAMRDPPKRWLTAKEYRETMGMAERTFYQKKKDGELPIHQVDGSMMYLNPNFVGE